jgi:hypothetical protein
VQKYEKNVICMVIHGIFCIVDLSILCLLRAALRSGDIGSGGQRASCQPAKHLYMHIVKALLFAAKGTAATFYASFALLPSRP